MSGSTKGANSAGDTAAGDCVAWRRAVATGAFLAVAVFVTFLVANQAYYLRHARWTDFELSYATPTAGGEFIEAGSRLALNPRMQTWIERSLSAEELAAMQAASRPFWGQGRGDGGRADWLARVVTVDRLKDTSPFQVRVSVHLADPWLAERVARLVLDEVMTSAMRDEMDREFREVLRLEREIAANGGVASEEIKEKLRLAAIRTGGSRDVFIRRIAPFSPRASAGRVMVWPHLVEVVSWAAVFALVAGLLGLIATRIFLRRGHEKAAVLAGGGLG